MASDISSRIKELRRAALALVETGDDALARIADAIDACLSAAPDTPLTFEQALALPPTWRSDWRRAERDAAWLRLRAQCCPQLKGRAAAHAVADAVRRYEGTAWRRDREACRRPDGLHGLCFDVLAHGGGSIGEETLRRLFAEVPEQHCDQEPRARALAG
jgi:hypothetical protein